MLPFDNLSGDPQQDYFSKGITEDILTDLARVPGLFVPSRNATSRYKGGSVDLRRVGADLGVRYVLEGSVRKSDDQVRVTAQLIEIATGSHAWAQRYDRPLKDIFSVQDEITQAIATRLVAQIKRDELAAARRKPTERMDAYDLVLQGRNALTFATAPETAKARSLFEKAIELDPNYADAFAGLSQVYTLYANYQWADIPPAMALEKAIEMGRRSLALDPSGAYVSYGLALAYIFRGQLDEAESLLTRARAAYPNDPELMERLGVTYIFEGKHQQGVDLMERALKVDPFHRREINYLMARGYVLMKNYDRTAELIKLCQAETPNARRCYEAAAVYFVETGQLDKARDAVATLRRLNSTFTLATAAASLPFRQRADLDRFLDAFRKAGLPE